MHATMPVYGSYNMHAAISTALHMELQVFLCGAKRLAYVTSIHELDREVNCKMASESAEYKTLIKCIDKLTIAFKSSLVLIANELLANGFISYEVHVHGNMLSTSGLGEDVKATRLVTCVTNMVKMCPGKYYDFMALPLFKEQWLNPLHEVITAEYGKQAYLQSLKAPLSSGLRDHVLEHHDIFNFHQFRNVKESHFMSRM